MNGPGLRALPYLLSFFSSLCIMVLELVASRLVARHVGGSLIVWTSVIGIMLGGICLGNVLGGRLADRVVPRRAIGPLYGLGALMVLLCLWVNAVVGLTPGLDSLPWDLRTLVVVTLNFLVPGTILGMISPVVAKMAVEQASKPGSAVGYVYMLGAIGSIVGTFLAGFYLMYLAPTSTIVTLIAAAYCLLAAMLFPGAARGVAAIGAVTLGVGGYLSALSARGALPGIPFDAVGSAPIDLAAQGLILVGHALTLVLAIMSVSRISGERAEYAGAEANLGPIDPDPNPMGARTSLWDLAALSFLASLAFMALEMVAGRLVTRHTGSSIYGWTSVIGVLLGGLSLGNFLGGKVADHVRSEKKASWLFLAASVLTACVLLAESPPRWLVRNPIGYFFQGADPSPLAGGEGAFLHQALGMTGYPWWFRILFWTTVVFFVPALTMGTVSPVVAKLAVDRLQRARRTGTAIGQVYAWGMVGSILGTFLTGFFLIDLLGTKGLILALSALLALAAFVLGGVIHAIWAGIPIGLCLIAFLPVPYLQKQAENFGIVEEKATPNASGDGQVAHLDESNYYYIKVTNYNENGRQNRTLVLDNLIHGYFILGHPDQLDYDYEHIYALVTKKLVETRKAEGKLSLDPTARPGTPLSTLFLGGGTYTFPRFLQARYPGTAADVAEIDPAVTHANHMATGLPWPVEPGGEIDGPPGIHTVWGDARQFVAKRHTSPKKYDVIFGDAFNDFSVPWHLTTTQFNEMIDEMLTDDGIFMINIIDLYQSDAQAREDAANGEPGVPTDPDQAVARARKLGGFLSSWYTTAKKTFPHIYVFGTNSGYEVDEEGEETFKPPGRGLRETFVVVASKKPMDLARLDLRSLGGRYADPDFPQDIKVFEPYDADDLAALEVRSQGIVLTDDYAPVENLLAPVAATRGEE